jgi:hypothetical protein
LMPKRYGYATVYIDHVSWMSFCTCRNPQQQMKPWRGTGFWTICKRQRGNDPSLSCGRWDI